MMNKDYGAKYEDYQFKIDWTSSEPLDPKNEKVDVKLITRDGEEYWANFTTPKFINYMFEKNRGTGECAGGSYFCMPGMIIVEKIDEQIIRKTIDDLIKNLEVEEYFKKVD